MQHENLSGTAPLRFGTLIASGAPGHRTAVIKAGKQAMDRCGAGVMWIKGNRIPTSVKAQHALLIPEKVTALLQN
jgi:hypothetical protein